MTQVLIVDDHEQNLYMLQVLLQGQGYEVRSARNGIEALDMARRQAPDLIITDILMPGMDGFSLCREWMADEKLQHVPLVFYTATYTDPKDEAFALSLGAARFIVKPTEPDAFVEILRQVLEDHAAQRLVSLDGPSQAAEVYYQQYNQALIRKLEDKMAQLKEANRSLELDITERKQAEKALREHEQRLTSIYDTVGDVIFQLAVEKGGRYRFASVNRAFLATTGLTSVQVVGKRVDEVIPEPSLTLVLEKYRQAIQEKRTVRWEETSEYPTGRLTGEVSVAPVFDSAGNCTHLVGAVHDITERKQAEARLYHLNEVLRAVRNVNQLIMRERDPQQLMSDACAILVQTRGYRMAWIGLIKAGHPRVMPVARAGQGTDYLDQVTLTWDESETGQGPTGAAIRTRRPAVCADVTTDPRFAPWREAALQRGFASVAAAPVMYGERLFGAVDVYADKPGAFDDEEISLLAELAGDLGFALQSIEDEAERRRAEEALRESEDKFKYVFDYSVVGKSITLPSGEISVNKALCEMLGYTQEELLNQRWQDITHPDDIELTRKAMGSLLSGEKESACFVKRYMHKSGAVVWTDVSSSLRRDKGGKPLYFMTTVSDITERKRAEAQLDEQLDELRRWHAVTLGRETRILDLKREVNELLARAGQPPRYLSAEIAQHPIGTENP